MRTESPKESSKIWGAFFRIVIFFSHEKTTPTVKKQLYWVFKKDDYVLDLGTQSVPIGTD